MKILATNNTVQLFEIQSDRLINLFKEAAENIALQYEEMENGAYGIPFDTTGNHLEEYRDVLKFWLGDYQRAVKSPVRLNAADYRDAKSIWEPILGRAIREAVNALKTA